MSHPRQVLPCATYLVTRRTILRHMLFRPDPYMNRVVMYLLIVLARAQGLEVHALCAMSTHIHLIVTDVRGTLPAFLHAFHRMVACCTRQLRDWQDVVWDKSPTSVVRLETEAAIVEKVAYVLANPVAAGLVRHADDWPGANVRVSELGVGSLVAMRPAHGLDPKNHQWPASASLRLTLPPCIAADKARSFRRQVAEELARLESQARAELRERGSAFLGPDGCRAVAPTTRATTPEPAIARNPTFAVGRGRPDARRQAANALRAFRMAYRAAFERWRIGIRDAVFPAGTWLMRVLHDAVVANSAMPVCRPPETSLGS